MLGDLLLLIYLYEADDTSTHILRVSGYCKNHT